MKQHITVEQLNELNDKNKDIIRYWLIEHHCQPTFIEMEGCLTPAPMETYYLPNIGMMIEFLDEHIKIGSSYEIVLKLSDSILENDGYWNFKPVDQWCDVLWDAVKEVLEK